MTTPTMTPSGWYPDPSRRHEFRFWDGSSWSSQVSDGGLTATDPELQPPTSPDVAPMVGPPAAAAAPAPTVGPPAAAAFAPTVGPPAAPGPALAAPARSGGRGWIIAAIAVFAVLAVVAGLVVWRVATSGPSAAEVYQQIRTSAAVAKSVHMKGSFTESGKKLQIDAAGDRAGTNTRVIVNDGTGVLEILTVNGDYYLKADAAFWTKNGSSEAAKVAADKYVKVPASLAASMSDLKMGTLLDKILAKDMTGAQNLNTNVEKTEINGVSAYRMTDKIGSDGSKIYASADGQARLLRLEGPNGEGSLDFTEWNAVPPVSPPPADQIVSLPGL